MPGAQPRAQFEQRSVVAQGVDHRAHVVHARSVLRNEVAQPPLVAARPLVGLVAEVREVLLRRRHGRRVVVDRDIDHSVGDLCPERPDLGGLVHAEAATFDHRRATHRDVGARDADDDVATPEDGGVPGEAVSRGDADERDQPAELREVVEREAVEAGDADPVGVTRAPTPSFGEEDDGQPPALGDLEQPVLLLVAEEPLRAREHGVVVRHHHDRLVMHRAHAADDAVGRRAVDELLE